jgi:hypothetical protein
MKGLWIVIPLALSAAPPAGELAADLDGPVQITAGGKPIDVQRGGHAAPFVGDFDGDGANDLLVGQFEEGRLRIYRNVGTNSQPRFDKYEWFKTGAELGRVPTG